MTEALDRLCRAMAAKSLTPFVGSGFSMAVTNNAPHAGWGGLLLDGIEVCERVAGPRPEGWASRTRDQLYNADAFTYIATADDITRRIRAVRNGVEFDSWIENTVGKLTPTSEGKQLIKAVRGLGKIIITTNYDTLIEDLEPRWGSRTWTAKDYARADMDPNIVVHMHGVASEPESIILSSADYERLSKEQLAQVIEQSLFARHRFVFIGCGDGLRDPNIAPLIKFVDREMLQKDTEHYLLVTGPQLRQYNERPLSPLISPVAYGGEFRDLAPFLQKLVDAEDIDVSQDPRSYEGNAAAPALPSLFDLAGLAQEKLKSALDALDDAERAMERVEYRDATSAGLNDWDFPGQKAAHEEVADRLTEPAADLRSCSERVLAAFQCAETEVWPLTAPKFARHAVRLVRITDRVVKLADGSRQLLARATQSRDDLEVRADISPNYEKPHEDLDHACRSIDRARRIAVSLREELGRDRRPEVQAAGREESARPPTQIRDTVTLSSGRSDTGAPVLGSVSDTIPAAPREPADPDVRSVPLLWEVAAGPPIPADVESVRDYLPLPAKHVRGEDPFMFQVRGDSMTGEDGILGGNYVIVDGSAGWENGNMVVVLIGGEATVKRIWREGESIHLQPSNPAHSTEILTEEDQSVNFKGKVIGVLRWDIKKGYRRADPPS